MLPHPPAAAHNRASLPVGRSSRMSPRPRLGRWLPFLALIAVVAAGLARPVSAQTGSPSPRLSQDLPDSDFLFKRPRGTLALRGGLLMPTEGSDLYTFVQERLTIDKGDFQGPLFAVELGYSPTARLDIVGGFDLARKSVRSEYRDFVDNNLQPIEQETSLRQNSFTGSVRFALVPRGRAVGSYAWIPTRVQPYVGGGGGFVFWEFKQVGDFIDVSDSSVFPDTFVSSGASLSGHLLGGIDIQVYKRLFLTTEARYVWAQGELSNEFVGFEPLDLSGFKLAAGINFVF
jgi:hypothetical protein